MLGRPRPAVGVLPVAGRGPEHRTGGQQPFHLLTRGVRVDLHRQVAGGVPDLLQVGELGVLAPADNVHPPAGQRARAVQLTEPLHHLQLPLRVTQAGGEQPPHAQHRAFPVFGRGQARHLDRRVEGVGVGPPQPADPVPGVDRVRHDHVVGVEVPQITRVHEQPGETQRHAGPEAFAPIGHPRPADRHAELAHIPGCRAGSRWRARCARTARRRGRERLADQGQLGPGGRGGQRYGDRCERAADVDAGKGPPGRVEDAQPYRPRRPGTADVGVQLSFTPGRDRENPRAVRPDPLPAATAFGRIPARPVPDRRTHAPQERAAGADGGPAPRRRVMIGWCREEAQVCRVP